MIIAAAEPASEPELLGLELRKPVTEPSALASFVPEKINSRDNNCCFGKGARVPP